MIKSRFRAGAAVTVEIEDVTAPATFSGLPAALSALWESLRALPLGWTQHWAYEHFFRPGVVERGTGFLERDGKLHLTFALDGRSHSVRVRPAESATARP